MNKSLSLTVGELSGRVLKNLTDKPIILHGYGVLECQEFCEGRPMFFSTSSISSGPKSPTLTLRGLSRKVPLPKEDGKTLWICSQLTCALSQHRTDLLFVTQSAHCQPGTFDTLNRYV